MKMHSQEQDDTVINALPSESERPGSTDTSGTTT